MRRHILLLPLPLFLIHTAPPVLSQTAAVVAPSAPGRLVAIYRNGTIPPNTDAVISSVGAHRVLHLARFGIASVQVEPGTEATFASRLLSRPEVAAVLRDRFVTAHLMLPMCAALPVIPDQDPSPSTANRATPNFVSAPSSPGLGRTSAKAIPTMAEPQLNLAAALALE